MENYDQVVTDRSIRLENLRSHIERMTIDDRFQGRYWVNATSGSSGHPGIFVFNLKEWLHVLVSFVRAYEWAGLRADLRRTRKVAVVSSTTPWHMSAQVGRTLRSRWVSTLQIAASDPLEVIVDRLNSWQPEVLICYASAVKTLAFEQHAGRLKISPRVVFSSSEVLTPQSRELIEKAWGKSLFNQYAATETAEIAAQCQHHNNMHIFEDMLILEPVDENYRAVPLGEYCNKLLVTVLFSRTLPLIRYELTDSVRISPSYCSCGLPFRIIDSIQGREEETLHFHDQGDQLISIHPNIFHDILDSTQVQGWQIIGSVQKLTMLLKTVTNGFDEEKFTGQLRKALDERGVTDVPIEIGYVTELPHSRSGKVPLIRSEN